ncbi:hypothetical protein D3C76_1541710 [compost metagenome]
MLFNFITDGLVQTLILPFCGLPLAAGIFNPLVMLRVFFMMRATERHEFQRTVGQHRWLVERAVIQFEKPRLDGFENINVEIFLQHGVRREEQGMHR